MQWMSEKLRHSGARLDSTSQSREMQGKQKELAKFLEPTTTFLQAGHRQRTGVPSGSLSQSGSSAPAGPALPSRRSICHPGDRWQSGGCRSGDVTLREPRFSVAADKGRGGQYLCQATNNPPGSRLHRHRSCERHKRRRCRCRGARAGCRWGSWVLIGKRQNRA